ncbi:hypothetical protein PUR49_32605 [Streptomyces sp. BE147]|uniref:hypothetical protein n=1 Tax=Streptomyces sp. BE147 TaxID=3002524 RepID=UPI002E76CAA9|nr:hypothetical protein [Streptomyces sp. BE147]MEE1741214.1 hypothetical protein [Streptomyces sp. BE147]
MPNTNLARRIHARLYEGLAGTEDLALTTVREAHSLDGQSDDGHTIATSQHASQALSLDPLDAAQLFSPGLTRAAALEALSQLANGADAIDWDTILDPYGLDTASTATASTGAVCRSIERPE